MANIVPRPCTICKKLSHFWGKGYKYWMCDACVIKDCVGCKKKALPCSKGYKDSLCDACFTPIKKCVGCGKKALPCSKGYDDSKCDLCFMTLKDVSMELRPEGAVVAYTTSINGVSHRRIDHCTYAREADAPSSCVSGDLPSTSNMQD